jgi:hypothetical protein
MLSNVKKLGKYIRDFSLLRPQVCKTLHHFAITENYRDKRCINAHPTNLTMKRSREKMKPVTYGFSSSFVARSVMSMHRKTQCFCSVKICEHVLTKNLKEKPGGSP